MNECNSCNENANSHDKAAVELRAGRSLDALRDLFYSCVLSAGIDRKISQKESLGLSSGQPALHLRGITVPTLNDDPTPEHIWAWIAVPPDCSKSP